MRFTRLVPSGGRWPSLACCLLLVATGCGDEGSTLDDDAGDEDLGADAHLDADAELDEGGDEALDAGADAGETDDAPADADEADDDDAGADDAPADDDAEPEADGAACDPAVCDDRNACNGEEVCTIDDRCVAGRPLDEGTPCTTELGATGVCLAELCRPLACGNGFVDPDEECDDGNTVAGDGCETDCAFSCHAADECRETPDNPCTTDTCDVAPGGRRCGRADNADACDDADECTAGDACSGGLCLGAAIDADADGWGPGAACGGDCDEANGDIHPGAAEACNATDDDCDTALDELFSCVFGLTEPCILTGATGTCGGTRSCNASCDWTSCTVTIAEICNSADDDCDGTIDDGFPCTPGQTGACTAGACAGTQTCSSGCAWGSCVVTTAETCNGVDDDCDATTDEGFSCPLGATEACTTACSTVGSRSCLAGCSWGACCATSETCENACDDDCDTLVDDGCPGTVPCTSDAPCTGSGRVCNENWGICAVTSCTGRPDFTPCELLTTPDRSYDICVAGACVSPGCGDATCNAPGPDRTLADTGLRNCYNATGGTSCPGTPGSAACSTTAFCGQDAQYGWDVTHAASERFTRSEPVAGQPVVADTVTGLQWQGCPLGRTGSTCAGTVSRVDWANALSQCDSLSWGGRTDWRLPDEYELQSLVRYDVTLGPMIDTTAFPGTPADFFWTSSAYAGTATDAWFVYFSTGITSYLARSSTYVVRCVRGAASPVARFVRSEPVAGFAVVADAATGLVWQGCAAGLAGSACTGTASTPSWQAALDYCQDSTWAGFTDWYLPNLSELRSIVDNRRTSPSADPIAFPATPANNFWSSSSRAADPVWAWVVTFSGGWLRDDDKTFTGRDRVRCVRRGP